MEEVLAQLDADWVVLSACNTATGAEAGAEAGLRPGSGLLLRRHSCAAGDQLARDV